MLFRGGDEMNKEEQTILKVRVTTLERYLEDVFVSLKDAIGLTVGREHSTRNIKLRELKGKIEKKLKKFREDLEYQDTRQIELEK